MSDERKKIEEYIKALDKKTVIELLEESGRELPNMVDMSATIGIMFDRAVKNFSVVGEEDPSLETINVSPEVRELMCLINLQDLHQKTITTVVAVQQALLKRLSAMWHDA